MKTLENRLPSFNDASPELLKHDIRIALQIINDYASDPAEINRLIQVTFFGGKNNKRASNIWRYTFPHCGLVDREQSDLDKGPVVLTPIGEKIRQCQSAEEATTLFARHLLLECNGLQIVTAAATLNARGEHVDKYSLKRELQLQGVENLSVATTDHTSHRNWLAEAGVLDADANYVPDDARLYAVANLDARELSALDDLDLLQRLFAVRLRVLSESRPSDWLQGSLLIGDCLDRFPALFGPIEDRMRKEVIGPLENEGWLETYNFKGGRHGKSGKLKASERLRRVPISALCPNFERRIPADVRRNLATPSEKIETMMESSSRNERGLGLEVLALRIALDIGLVPTKFRSRSKDEGYNEADLIAEGDHLMFSRWLVQCKNTRTVSVSDIAREVGLAIYNKSHVLMIVTTGGVSHNARRYAEEITRTTNMQFVFIEKKALERYLNGGVRTLIQHLMKNARQIMQKKKDQISLGELDAEGLLGKP